MPTVAKPDYKVFLIGNYAADRQRSMQRYAGLLQLALERKNIEVEILRPVPVFGKLGASPHGFGKWLGYLDKFLIFPLKLRRRLRRERRPVLVHICDHSNAFYTRWLADVPHLVTCHDLLAVRSAIGEFPENPTSWTGRRLQAMILRGLRRSRCIVSVSAATRDDVIRLAADRPDYRHVIPNALDAVFLEEATQPPPTGEARPGALSFLQPGTKYVLHVGGGSWYKNRSALLRIFARLAAEQPELQLVVVGPQFAPGEISDADCAAITERIHHLAGLDDAALRDIYRAASMLLFPSRIEGFGWPILEAQACGCPVATLDRAPMNELNACEALKLPASDVDSPGWVENAAAQCLAFIQSDISSRKSLQSKLKAHAARYSPEMLGEHFPPLYTSLINHSSIET